MWQYSFQSDILNMYIFWKGERFEAFLKQEITKKKDKQQDILLPLSAVRMRKGNELLRFIFLFKTN